MPDPPTMSPPVNDTSPAPASPPERAFAAERSRHIRQLGEDEELHALSRLWMMRSSRHKYTYNFSWLGRPVIQFPQDLFAIQEIIWRTQPDLIIETGVAHGGSILFWASILQLIGGDRSVIGIDIDIRPHNHRAIIAHPLASRITLIEGSSIDHDVARRVGLMTERSDRVMLILDSDHSHDHVLRELHLYGPLVTAGCYLIVFDTIIEDLPRGFLNDPRWDKGNNPKTAVREYLRTTDRFQIDRDIPAKLLITAAPNGYLRCVKDSG